MIRAIAIPPLISCLVVCLLMSCSQAELIQPSPPTFGYERIEGTLIIFNPIPGNGAKLYYAPHDYPTCSHCDQWDDWDQGQWCDNQIEIQLDDRRWIRFWQMDRKGTIIDEVYSLEQLPEKPH